MSMPLPGEIRYPSTAANREMRWEREHRAIHVSEVTHRTYRDFQTDPGWRSIQHRGAIRARRPLKTSSRTRTWQGGRPKPSCISSTTRSSTGPRSWWSVRRRLGSACGRSCGLLPLFDPTARYVSASAGRESDLGRVGAPSPSRYPRSTRLVVVGRLSRSIHTSTGPSTRSSFSQSIRSSAKTPLWGSVTEAGEMRSAPWDEFRPDGRNAGPAIPIRLPVSSGRLGETFTKGS